MYIISIKLQLKSINTTKSSSLQCVSEKGVNIKYIYKIQKFKHKTSSVTYPLPSKSILSPFPADTPCKLNILRHDGHPLCMDGTQVGILKQTHKIGLCSLLES